MNSTNNAAKLTTLNIQLPAASKPAGAYAMACEAGQTLYVSGHISKKDGKVWVGQLGATMQTEEGKEAARLVAIDLLATLTDQLGSLDKIERIVKMTSLVNSTSSFTEQHLVTDGASELFKEIFGDHARSAFGVAQLPLGACVEIELIVQLRS